MIRWDSFERRQFLRNKLFPMENYKLVYKLLFVFNWTNSTTSQDLERLRNESQAYHDLILPKVEDSYYNQACFRK